MKKIIFLLFLSISTFAQQAPMKLWYTQPAEHFEESLVLGNGRIGATVFGGTSSDKIYLNDITLWSGAPKDPNMNPEAHTYMPLVRAALKADNYALADSLIRNIQGSFSESYAPLGTLTLDFDVQKTQNYYRELSLDDATATVRFDAGNNHITKEYFVSHPDRVFVIKLKASQRNSLNFSINFSSLLTHQKTTKGKLLEAHGEAPIIAQPSYLGNIPNPVIFEKGKGHKVY